MSILTFIGAGQMASSLTFPATLNGHQIRLVGTHLDRDIIDSVQKTGFHPTLKRQLPKHNITAFQIEAVLDAIAGADAILCGVSSFGVDWFAKNILPLIPDSIPVLSVTKGMIDLEDGSMMTYPDYFASKLPPGKELSLNAIGGPCTSYELADGDHTTVAFCGKNKDDLQFFKNIFEGPYYHISLSTDVQGVECAVALKNAYALGVSLAVGLAIGTDGKGIEHYNSQAALFGQSVKEMRKLLSLIGGKDENIIYGAGDLYVTIFGGRTRRIGTLLGQGHSFEDAMKQLEGVTLESIVIAARTARAVRKLAADKKTRLSDFPLLMHVNELISQNKRVAIPWQLFEDTFCE